MKNKNINTPELRGKIGINTGIIGLIANIFLSIIKIIIGILSHSISIISDGVNSISDIGTSILTIISFYFGKKTADKKHPFGHARIEYLYSIAVATIIISVSASVIPNIIASFKHPQIKNINLIEILILLISFIIKLILVKFYKTRAKLLNSEMLKAVYTDASIDLIATFSVLVSIIFYNITSINIDTFVGLVIIILVMKGGIEILISCFNNIIGAPPNPQEIKNIKYSILNHKHILSVHDIMIHDYGTGYRYATADVEINSNLSLIEAHSIIDEIQEKIYSRYKIKITIHIDPIDFNDLERFELLKKTENAIYNYNDKMWLHDFRLIGNNKNRNIKFEILIPSSVKTKDSQIRSDLNLIFNNLFKNRKFEWILDRDYSCIGFLTEHNEK